MVDEAPQELWSATHGGEYNLRRGKEGRLDWERLKVEHDAKLAATEAGRERLQEAQANAAAIALSGSRRRTSVVGGSKRAAHKLGDDQ